MKNSIASHGFAFLKTRNQCAWRLLLGSVVACMLLGMLSAPLAAQAQPGPPVKALVIQVGTAQPREMSTKKRIKEVSEEDPNVVSVSGSTPTSVIIFGRALGTSTITLTDVDGKKDVFRVVVVPYDIRVLRENLEKIVPSATVEAIPVGPNAIALKGTVDRAEDITAVLDTARFSTAGAQLINHLRVGGVQQVQLDVVVATVSRSELRAFGFNFFASSGNFFLGSTVGQVVVNPVTIGANSLELSSGGALRGIPGTPNGQPTNLFAGILHDSWGFLQFMQALRNEGVLKLLAKPRLVTTSGQLASFLSGGEQAIPVPAGLGQIGVQFEEFGTRLNFVPVVLGNGKIHLAVEPEVSFLDPAAGTNIQGTIVPGRSTQRVRTTVEMEAGQTFVIGGLIQRTVNAITSKTPILGDLPFLGAAFSTKSFNEVETEMVILVTPYFVDPLDCNQLPKLLPGQETRSPDDFELFLEGIMEAPRGQREVFPNGTYVPAHKTGPTSNLFPCNVGQHPEHWGALKGKLRGLGCRQCGNAGCQDGNCGAAHDAVMPPAETAAPTGTMLEPLAEPLLIEKKEKLSSPKQLPPVKVEHLPMAK